MKEDQDKQPLANRLDKALIEVDGTPYVYKSHGITRKHFKKEISENYIKTVLYQLTKSIGSKL